LFDLTISDEFKISTALFIFLIFEDLSYACASFTAFLSGLSNVTPSTSVTFDAFFFQSLLDLSTSSLILSFYLFSALISSKVSLAFFLAFTNLVLASSAISFLISAFSLKTFTFDSALLEISSFLSCLGSVGLSSYFTYVFGFTGAISGSVFSSLASPSS